MKGPGSRSDLLVDWGWLVEVLIPGLGIQAPLVPFLPPGCHLRAALVTALLAVFLPLGYQEFVSDVAGENHNPSCKENATVTVVALICRELLKLNRLRLGMAGLRQSRNWTGFTGRESHLLAPVFSAECIWVRLGPPGSGVSSLSLPHSCTLLLSCRGR